jgi:hypothetical protein
MIDDHYWHRIQVDQHLQFQHRQIMNRSPFQTNIVNHSIRLFRLLRVGHTFSIRKKKNENIIAGID